MLGQSISKTGSSDKGWGYAWLYLGVTPLHISSESPCRTFNAATGRRENGFRKQLCSDVRIHFRPVHATPPYTIPSLPDSRQRQPHPSANCNPLTKRNRCFAGVGQVEISQHVCLKHRTFYCIFYVLMSQILGYYSKILTILVNTVKFIDLMDPLYRCSPGKAIGVYLHWLKPNIVQKQPIFETKTCYAILTYPAPVKQQYFTLYAPYCMLLRPCS